MIEKATPLIKKYLLLLFIPFSCLYCVHPNTSPDTASTTKVSKEPFPQYQYQTWNSPTGKALNYRILYPNNFDESQKYPLFIFLHGMGERGTQNQQQLTHGAQLLADSIGSYPAVVIFPQCPAPDYWANLSRPDTGGSKRIFTFHTEQGYNPSLGMAVELIDHFLEQPFIDQKRLYLSGLSMGGFGVWELLWRMPEKIAAAAPICGGGPLTKVKEMSQVPIWVFHGADDSVVHTKYSSRMIEPIKKLGGDIKFSLYPGVDHDSWDNAFAEPDFLKWFFSKRKE